MMKYAYDLHIHSVLSPCADELMTPNNILNMAMLNGLDFLAVTDHNCIRQLDSLIEIANSYDFILIPGVEVQVQGVHVLCYFTDLKTIKRFSLFIENTLIKTKTYLDQSVMDLYDRVLYNYPYYLLNDLNITFEQLLIKVKELNGIAILSHLDRTKFSALKQLNEENISLINGIELTKNCNIPLFLNSNPLIKNKPILINSDAHQIVSISLRDNFLKLKNKSIEDFFEFFHE